MVVQCVEGSVEVAEQERFGPCRTYCAASGIEVHGVLQSSVPGVRAMLRSVGPGRLHCFVWTSSVLLPKTTQTSTTTTNPRCTMSQTLTATLDSPASSAIMLHTPKDMQDYFQDAHPSSPSASAIHASSPEQLVDKALYALEKAGVQLIEWKSLLYRRMGVPVILKVRIISAVLRSIAPRGKHSLRC